MKIAKTTKTAFFALTLTAALALTACTNTPASSTPATPEGGTTPESSTATPLPDDILNQPVTVPEGNPGVDSEMGVDPGTGEALAPDEELSAMVDSLYAAHPVELMMLQTSAIDLTSANWARYNAGLDAAQAAKVDAAVLSESMTGSQAYSLVLARVKDPADAQEIADAMLENIDNAKWVCVMADTERVVTFGDKVLFIMAGSELTDINAFVDDAAKTLAVTFDYDMTRTTEDAPAPVVTQ